MNTKILAAKALGFTNAISRISDSERKGTPSKSYGDDYNMMIDHIVNLNSALADYLPPKATFYESYGVSYCSYSYAEILTYCEQIYQMLNALE